MDVGEQVDPGHGQEQGGQVTPGSDADRGEQDRAEELDRPDGAQGSRSMAR
jgi:hypothetical protein